MLPNSDFQLKNPYFLYLPMMSKANSDSKLTESYSTVRKSKSLEDTKNKVFFN